MDAILLVALIILIFIAIWLIMRLWKMNTINFIGAGSPGDKPSVRPNPFTKQTSPSSSSHTSDSLLHPPSSSSHTTGDPSSSSHTRPSPPMPPPSFSPPPPMPPPVAILNTDTLTTSERIEYKDISMCYPPIDTSSRDALKALRNAKKALVFPGGGIRGAIQSSFLLALQNELTQINGNTHVPIENSFDIIGGTSTGAIIAAALRARGVLDAGGMEISKVIVSIIQEFMKINPKGYKQLIDTTNIHQYSYESRCEFIYAVYELFGRIIFQKIDDAPSIDEVVREGKIEYIPYRRSTFVNLANTLLLKPLLPKYTDINLKIILSYVFGNQKLSDVNKDLLIMASNLTSRKCTMFRSWQTSEIQHDRVVKKSISPAINRHMELEQIHDADELSPMATPDRYILREVVRASTAAPTYFSPQAVHITEPGSSTKTSDAQEYVDGGIMVNNASDLALMELMTRYQSPNYVIVTIGNGLFTKDIDEKVMGTEDVRNLLVTQLADIIKAPMKGSEGRTLYTLKKTIKLINTYAGRDIIHWIHINFRGEGVSSTFNEMDNVEKDHVRMLRSFGKNTLYDYLDQDVKKALLATSIPLDGSGDAMFESFLSKCGIPASSTPQEQQ